MRPAARYALGFAIAATGALRLLAAEPASQRKSLIESTKSLWNPEAMMQQACDGISRHYDLDPAQKDFTCKLLTQRTTRFLDKHEAKIWPLLGELMPYQYSGDQPKAQMAQRIANEGYGIFEEARVEIMKAQDDFRTILNDQQKQIHDRDLKGLERTFKLIDKRFNDWKKGNVSGRAPLHNIRPPGSRRSLIEPLPRATSTRIRSATEWERYVRDLVRKYNLDEPQKISAQAILKDLQEQANQYRQAHAKDLAEAQRFMREARRTRPVDPQLIEQAVMIRDMLHKPFDDWFEELKSRLDQIPTEKQKQEYRQRAKQLEDRATATRNIRKPTETTADDPGKKEKSASDPNEKAESADGS